MHTKKEIIESLHKRFGEDTIMIEIPELSGLIKLSTGTIKNYLSQGKYLPRYFKLGSGSKNSAVRFMIDDVAQYLLHMEYKEYLKTQGGVLSWH